MQRGVFLKGAATLGLAALCGISRADVKPNGLIVENAVLQQGISVPIWGTSDETEEVTVQIQNQKLTTKAINGQWMVRLKPLRVGGPYTLTITGKNTIEYKNILVGEVWVCSGQSNMQWAINQSLDPEGVKAKSEDKNLRLFTVPRRGTPMTQLEVKGEWKESGPTTVGDFSAVAYHFGAHLRKNLKVPVGLISTNYGGTRVEAWTSRTSLEASFVGQQNFDAQAQAVANYGKALEAHKAAVEKAQADGKPAPRAPGDPNTNPNQPSGLYNAMISPLIPYAIKGAIWYQGESNAGQPFHYRTLFPLMISDWRKNWGQGDFPFFFVQLAPYRANPANDDWAFLRESQLFTTCLSPNTGQAVITDFGDANDIHPKAKEPVGTRLAMSALGIAYKKRIEISGPNYVSHKVDGNKIVLSFDHLGGGLVAKDGPLKGFTIAGEDRKFVPATAEIVGRTVVVHAEGVTSPVAVRFGWHNIPDVNLFNKAGLPATPFRTDEFPWK